MVILSLKISMSIIVSKNNQNINSYSKKELFNLLIKCFPDKISGWNSKEFTLRLEYKTAFQLTHKKWIEYNIDFIHFLIIDIDNNTDMELLLQKSIQLNCKPTIICQTDKGVQLFWYLPNRIKYEWETAINFLKDIKRVLTKLFNADTHASHRLTGIWRNPLLHPFIFTGEYYNLSDFKPLLQRYHQSKKSLQQRFNQSVRIHKIQTNNFKFEIGNRNNFLWFNGMAWSHNKNYSETQILNYLLTLSNSELPLIEIEKIAKSIHKYNQLGKNYIKFTPLKNKVNKGAMQFQPIHNLSAEEYQKEVKRRQSLSAKRTNKLKADKTYKKVVTLLTSSDRDLYKSKNGNWNISKIAKTLNIKNRAVIKKYINQFQLNN